MKAIQYTSLCTDLHVTEGPLMPYWVVLFGTVYSSVCFLYNGPGTEHSR